MSGGLDGADSGVWGRQAHGLSAGVVAPLQHVHALCELSPFVGDPAVAHAHTHALLLQLCILNFKTLKVRQNLTKHLMLTLNVTFCTIFVKHDVGVMITCQIKIQIKNRRQ